MAIAPVRKHERLASKQCRMTYWLRGETRFSHVVNLLAHDGLIEDLEHLFTCVECRRHLMERYALTNEGIDTLVAEALPHAKVRCGVKTIV
jgi:hypothetical protein